MFLNYLIFRILKCIEINFIFLIKLAQLNYLTNFKLKFNKFTVVTSDTVISPLQILQL